MKSFFSTLLTAIVLSAPAFAQGGGTMSPTTDAPRGQTSQLRFGAFIAPTMSWMKPTAAKDDNGEFNVSNNGSKIGFIYGLMAEYYFTENYALATGLQINTTGGKIISDRIAPVMNNQIDKADFDYSLQFLEIPLALKLRTDNINGIKFFGQLGVTAGINIGKKATYTVNYRNNNGADTTATGEKIKLTGGLGIVAPVLFQMNLGAGIEYPFSNKLAFYAGIFFNNGFAPDATNPEKFDGDKLGYGSATFRDGNTRLNNIALRLGLFF
jgi:hypothetical protein